ncbi:20S proteasome subunit (alpha or beta) [Chthonomonas calidirosea]|uniref:20S proteasome, alpha and beta subunits n=1 Tax=Chthonomonas calidirosea (strain DSM 23976 / ICMP 18418 / T49) TaxID=1303518 RepID=S0EZ70_CHTCT|nr:20S proteasome, alpha and beta subunits [Chthonomonas calidirosea]CCW36023.1 20S proteasome, alpha and beta subunits [Chthonomonas calidirosea T49]CEK17516.1 20S proteasome subunit (alpha or beta) [Chthonomonas calidirosea]CEK18559.1 20S proteasome subunit (alpha or beta) [Chthonomonas calidirosea]
MYTPFDINEAVAQRREFVEEGLRTGSPVVGLRYKGGLLLFTVRRAQRKIYEIYDRQMFSAIGRQSDIENVRLAAIQTAHQEGFERSPDDVSLHRLVGFALSPTLKRAFGDPMYIPIVIRALFAELGKSAKNDVFVTLNYDGEYRQTQDVAVIAGTQIAEDRMLERLEGTDPDQSLHEALERALLAWAAGMREALRGGRGIKTREEEEESERFRLIEEADSERAFLRDELKTGTIEAAVLERDVRRESRFRLLTEKEFEPLLREYR